MASSIPRARKLDYAAAMANKNLKVAFFSELAAYDELTATTYSALIAICTEVSDAGTGYTTGGYALTGKASSLLATNGAIMTCNPTSVSTATFTASHAAIYDSATDKLEGIVDFGGSYPVTNGTITITWDTVSGLFNWI